MQRDRRAESGIRGDRCAAAALMRDHFKRIAEEATMNVARHASAQSAEIATRANDGALETEVRDDGVGTLELVTRGFVRRTMRDRANAIGADLQIGRTWPHGARVSIRLPLRSTAENGMAAQATAWRAWSS